VRVMFVGDTHGFADWLRGYIFPVAMTLQVDALVVLGDFGAWEHTIDGVAYMDEVNELCVASGIPLYWLHGNHDKHSHTLKAYGDIRDRRGFLVCRDFVFYIPQGHTWSWGGVSFRSFGGAYSVDKAWRIQHEQERYLHLLRKANDRAAAGGKHETVEPTAGTLWFPEEEMTDAEMDDLLAADSSRKQIVLSHDKPYSAKPTWNRKELPGCVPNQLRLERALRAHQPAYWLHGHLHYHYLDRIQGDGWQTTVIGLEPDDHAAEPGWKPKHTWALAELADGTVSLNPGTATFVDRELRKEAGAALA